MRDSNGSIYRASIKTNLRSQKSSINPKSQRPSVHDLVRILCSTTKPTPASIDTAKTWHSRSKTQLTLSRYQNLSTAPTDMSYATLAYIVVGRLCTFYNAVRAANTQSDTSQARRKNDIDRKRNNLVPGNWSHGQRLVVSASQRPSRSRPVSVPKPTGVGRKAGNAPQRSDPGKVSASDGLTLDLCDPCARIQRRVSLSDSPFANRCLGLFPISPGGITSRWLDTAHWRQMFTNRC